MIGGALDAGPGERHPGPSTQSSQHTQVTTYCLCSLTTAATSFKRAFACLAVALQSQERDVVYVCVCAKRALGVGGRQGIAKSKPTEGKVGKGESKHTSAPRVVGFLHQVRPCVRTPLLVRRLTGGYTPPGRCLPAGGSFS
jgi:hypothetical protein